MFVCHLLYRNKLSYGGARHGPGGLAPKMSLTPTVKYAGHESGGELCEGFKF